jgi:hypothetical protein
MPPYKRSIIFLTIIGVGAGFYLGWWQYASSQRGISIDSQSYHAEPALALSYFYPSVDKGNGVEITNNGNGPIYFYGATVVPTSSQASDDVWNYDAPAIVPANGGNAVVYDAGFIKNLFTGTKIDRVYPLAIYIKTSDGGRYIMKTDLHGTTQNGAIQVYFGANTYQTVQ